MTDSVTVVVGRDGKRGLYLSSAIRTGPATFIEVCCLTLVEVVAAVGVEGAGVLEQQG